MDQAVESRTKTSWSIHEIMEEIENKEEERFEKTQQLSEMNKLLAFKLLGSTPAEIYEQAFKPHLERYRNRQKTLNLVHSALTYNCAYEVSPFVIVDANKMGLPK